MLLPTITDYPFTELKLGSKAQVRPLVCFGAITARNVTMLYAELAVSSL